MRKWKYRHLYEGKIVLINGTVNGTPSHSYGVLLDIWDHTMLPVTRHKWTRPALTKARQAVTRFTNTPEGWKAELTQVTGYIPRWFTRPQTVTHPSTHLTAKWWLIWCQPHFWW